MSKPWLYKVGKLLCRVITTVMFDLKAYGAKNVPPRGGVLLAANHQSYLDPVVVGVQVRRTVSFLARSELFKNPVFGWLIRSVNAFPIRQGAGDIGAIRETIQKLQQGHMLNIFPEGGRCPDGKLQPIEPGVALIIRKAKVPVVPVAIVGAFEAWPRHRKLFRPHPVRVMYGKPMELHHLKAEQIQQALAQAIGSMMMELERTLPRRTPPPASASLE